MSENQQGAPVGTPRQDTYKDTQISDIFQGVGGLNQHTNGIKSVLDNATKDPYLVDPSETYGEPHFSLFRDGVGFMTRGDIQAVKAKSKSGKSFLCTIFMASLMGQEEFSLATNEAEPTVLYFDTEQHKRNTQKLVWRVHTMMGWPLTEFHDGFRAYSLRTMDTHERLAYIETKVKEQKPTAVFIDGIVDLLTDFNDIAQSADLIGKLMRLSAENDCCLCCVLHTNKSKDDHNMRGQLGTMLAQKASDVFEVEKNGYTFNVKQTECRNEPIADFAFVLDGHGIPHPTETRREQATAERLSGIKEILSKALAGTDGLRQARLVEAYQAHAPMNEDGKMVCEKTAWRHIKKALNGGILKTEGELYKLV